MSMSMESAESGAGVWKASTMTLAGMLATGVSAWLLFAQEAVTREEVSRMLRTETPYIEDRKLIQETLGRNSASIERCCEAIEQLRGGQHRMDAKLDLLLSRKEAAAHAQP